MSRNPWDNLIELMEKQKKMYDKFRELLKKKEKAVVEGDINKLQKLIKEEEKSVNEIEKTEQRRIEAVEACIAKKQKMTIGQMIDLAPPEKKEGLNKAAMELIKALDSVATLNRTNAELINEAMNFINFNVNLLSSNRAVDNLYEGTGRMKGSEPKVLGIINKEA